MVRRLGYVLGFFVELHEAVKSILLKESKLRRLKLLRNRIGLKDSSDVQGCHVSDAALLIPVYSTQELDGIEPDFPVLLRVSVSAEERHDCLAAHKQLVRTGRQRRPSASPALPSCSTVHRQLRGSSKRTPRTSWTLLGRPPTRPPRRMK